MALSGSYDFNTTTTQLIEAALRKVGVEAANSAQLADGRTALNMLLKAWALEGHKIWNIEWAQQALSASSVVVGTDGNDYECIKNHTSVTADKPITGANYTTFWKATGGTGSGAAWVTITQYTSICQYALNANVQGITEAFLRRDYTDSPLTIMSREDYLSLGSKTSTGQPTHIWFKSQHTPDIFLYPFPDTSTDIVHMALVRKPQDADIGTDDIDVISGWLLALTYQVAADLSVEYGLDLDRTRWLQARASAARKKAEAGSQDSADARFILL